MTNTVKISREEIRKAHYPNWYVYDKLRCAGFPFKLKKEEKSLARFKDLDFENVEFLGCYTIYDNIDETVYEFDPIYTFNTNDLRDPFCKKFLEEK